MHTVTYTVPEDPRPSCLLRFAQEAAEDHCLLLGADWDSMAALGYFWAVIRQKLEIARMPQAGETITVKTWPLPTTRVAYPRATEGFDAQGNSVFKIISLWVIMDTATRAMVLPGKSGVCVEGTAYGTELKAPGGLSVLTAGSVALRTVCEEDLDVNGHMNNARYLDWITDLAPAGRKLQAVTICYMSEATLGQALSLRTWEGEHFRVDGTLDGTRIFSADLEF